MNSRKSSPPPAELEASIRYTLRAGVASQQPSPDVRRRVMRRAAQQKRRQAAPETQFESSPVPDRFYFPGASSGADPLWTRMSYVDSRFSLRFGPFMFALEFIR
jgi:hypothetical protein